MMAIEVLFNVGQHDIRYRIARSVAVLLGEDKERADFYFDRVREAYDFRSQLVHTGKTKGLNRIDIWFLRSLVRRAIAALIELDMAKDKVADALTKLGFGDGGAANNRLEADALKRAAQPNRLASKAMNAETAIGRQPASSIRRSRIAHGLQSTQIEQGHVQAPRLAMWAAPLSQAHRGPVGRVPASLQRFTGNPSPLVSGSDWWERLGPTIRCSLRRGSPSLFQPLLSGVADLVSVGV